MSSRNRPVILAAAALLTLTACERETAPAAPSAPDPRPFAEVLAAEGLAAAEKKLASQPKAPETDFLLAGVQFLRAIEEVQQIRYANYGGALSWLPGMRTELPPNPAARFDPAFLERCMKAALGRLREAESTAAGAIGKPFTAELRLEDVWLDINANGTRDDWEGVRAMMGQLQARPAEGFDGIIRFDTADADWLKAYIHFLSGIAELTLSVDPTPAIRQISDARAGLEKLGPLASPFGEENSTLPETVAATLLAFRGRPDRARTRAALAHLRGMMAHGQAFWERVAEETDNDHEWLPNAAQVSAFGVAVTEETAKEWQGVLAELSAILEGKALIPFWRFQYGPDTGAGSTGLGVNIGRLMQDPPDTDLILIAQGASLVPYFETGRLANMAAWDRFSRSVSGNAFLFAAWMN